LRSFLTWLVARLFGAASYRRIHCIERGVHMAGQFRLYFPLAALPGLTRTQLENGLFRQRAELGAATVD